MVEIPTTVITMISITEALQETHMTIIEVLIVIDRIATMMRKKFSQIETTWKDTTQIEITQTKITPIEITQIETSTGIQASLMIDLLLLQEDLIQTKIILALQQIHIHVYKLMHLLLIPVFWTIYTQVRAVLVSLRIVNHVFLIFRMIINLDCLLIPVQVKVLILDLETLILVEEIRKTNKVIHLVASPLKLLILSKETLQTLLLHMFHNHFNQKTIHNASNLRMVVIHIIKPIEAINTSKMQILQ